MWLTEYTNIYYHEEWAQTTPYTKRPYAVGTIAEDKDGTFAVYDGAHNWMGHFDQNGKITYNGDPSEYMTTFLESAVAYAKEQGKIK